MPMKTKTTENAISKKVFLILLCCTALQFPLLAAEEPKLEAEEGEKTWVDKLPNFVKDGKLLVHARLRYEYADAAGLKPSNAFTERIALGYKTGNYYGFEGLLEFVDTRPIGSENNVNLAGTTGQPLRRNVADPQSTEVNQAWIGFNKWDTALRYGRQQIVYDNARFIGDVIWRNNQQTYDAWTFSNNSVKDLSITYSYIFNVNRIFGDSHHAGNFDSDSHIARISYSGIDWVTVAAAMYLLDFNNSAANSSDTFHFAAYGGVPVGDFKVNYRGEYAHQSGSGNNPTSYDASYYLLEGGASYDRYSLKLGYEVLGADGPLATQVFKTPLATAHKFNGWADAFLATPAGGLTDLYVAAGVKLSYDIPLSVIYHHFQSDRGGVDFGNEIDVIATKKLGKHWSLLAKYAHLEGNGPFVDLDNFWFQVEFKY